MRIFLTGATGYLGGAVARRLLEEGHDLRLSVRDPDGAAPWRALGASLHPGDITDRYSLRPGMSGADAVIHLAGAVDLRLHPREMIAVNDEGAENIASLAYKLGVGRLINLSSIACWGGSPEDGSAATEETPRLPWPNVYGESKFRGEEKIRAWAERGLRVDTLFPSLIYGPPGKSTGANPLLRRIAGGELRFLPGAGQWSSWIYIVDVVDAILKVLHRESAGERFILAGEARPLRELVDLVCRLAEVRPPRIHLPLSLLRPGLWGLRGLEALGIRPEWGSAHLSNLFLHWHFDDRKAREALKWTPRSLEEGLRLTLSSWNDPEIL